MPTKIGDNSDTFANIPTTRTEPRSPIFAEDFWAPGGGTEDGIINNQAVCYQTVTNKQLDDSTGYSGSEQAHDGTTGALLSWPLSTFDFGDSSWTTSTSLDRNLNRPTVFANVLAASGTTQRVLYKWPVFIPAGHDECRLYIYADADFDLIDPIVRQYDTSFTQEGYDIRNPNKYDMGGGVFAYEFPILFGTPSAVYVLSLDMDLTGVNAAQTLQTKIFGGALFPRYWKQWDNLVPQTEISSPTGDADPNIGSAWQSTWDTYTATQRPVSSYVTKRMAENDTFLHELVTGSPAAGASSITTAGHIHDGTTLGGATIDMSLGSSLCGWPVRITAGADGLMDDATEGDHGQAPHINGDTEAEDIWYTLYPSEIWVPTRTGTPTMNWAAIIYEPDDYQGEASLGISTDYSSWSYSTAQVVTGAGFSYVTGSITVTSATRHYIRLAAQVTGDGKPLDTNTTFCLCGFTLWMDA